MEHVVRCLRTLACLPPHPNHITTPEVLRKLQDDGFNISLRTVQRDLEQLAGVFPIGSQEQGRKLAWCWSSKATLFSIPAMDSYTALIFLMAEMNMKELFPASVNAMLKPYFLSAREVLKKENRHLGDWRKKVGFVPRAQPLKPAPVKPKVMHAVHEALLRDKQLSVRYQKRGASKSREQKLNPLALIHVNGIGYLICTFWNYSDVCHLPLHRFSSAKPLETPAHKPSGFNLEGYLREDRALEYRRGGEIRLEALFATDTARHLQETPLSSDQRCRKHSDGWTRLTATVQDTSQLRWWLLGFGDLVQIIGPRTLRKEFSQIARKMHESYRKNTTPT